MVLAAKLCLTLATPWTVPCQASLSMGFSRQGYWSGLLFPSPEEIVVGLNTTLLALMGSQKSYVAAPNLRTNDFSSQ